MSIEQPQRQTGPRESHWFYSICSCGKLVAITGGVIPEHRYTIAGFWGAPTALWLCDQGGKTHDSMRQP